MGTTREASVPPPPTAVVERVAAAADPDGFVPFDRYEEVVLYDPSVGYYARPRGPFGPRGDFYTAPRVSPLFAASFAERIRAERARLGPGGTFRLVELGPGDGTLLEGVLRHLGPASSTGPEMEVVVVERSDALARAAVERVAPAAAALGAEVRPADSVSSLGPFEGVVLANELLDAQPVRRFRRTVDGWRELGVRVDGGRLRPAESGPRRPVPGTPLPDGAAEGVVFECSPAAEGLVREVADHLVRGAFLIDDYGMEESELVAGHPRGTLDGIREHRGGEDPLARPGETDLSAFVNFTRLRAAAERAGLTLTSDLRQAEALGAWGLPRLMEEALAASPRAEGQVRIRLAVKNLLFGFERFRILEYAAGSRGAVPPLR